MTKIRDSLRTKSTYLGGCKHTGYTGPGSKNRKDPTSISKFERRHKLNCYLIKNSAGIESKFFTETSKGDEPVL